jgi:hypothetical protein
MTKMRHVNCLVSESGEGFVARRTRRGRDIQAPEKFQGSSSNMRFRLCDAGQKFPSCLMTFENALKETANGQVRWEMGGKGWEEKFDFARELKRGGKTVEKFPPEAGKESAVLLRKWKGGGNFPAFPAIDPLECGIRSAECGIGPGFSVKEEKNDQ